MRVTIKDEILNLILTECKNKQITDGIKKAIQEAKKHNQTLAKKEHMKKVNEDRIKVTKNKIQNAINLLKLEDKKINAYQVAKSSGLNYNTVHKYFKKGDFVKP